MIWKSGVSFNQAVKELNDNFQIVDKFITEEKVKSNFEYICKPKKVESHLTNFSVKDLGTQNTDKAGPYVFCFYRLSKLAGRYSRNLTSDEIDKCKKDTIVFDGDNCVNNALDFCLQLKGEERKTINNKIVENNLQLHAHNSSGFDIWIVLNNLHCDKHIVDIIENGEGIISLRVFNGYIHNGEKQILHYLFFQMWYDSLKL